jgi:hypothetical protein
MQDWWGLTEEAFTGKFALMYNRCLVTDFIYDAVSELRRGFELAHDFGFIALRIGDSWGIVDKNGDTVLAFIFEKILFFNEFTVFEKYNGRYGVLDISILQGECNE